MITITFAVQNFEFGILMYLGSLYLIFVRVDLLLLLPTHGWGLWEKDQKLETN